MLVAIDEDYHIALVCVETRAGRSHCCYMREDELPQLRDASVKDVFPGLFKEEDDVNL